jgi:hypothetical protein
MKHTKFFIFALVAAMTFSACGTDDTLQFYYPENGGNTGGGNTGGGSTGGNTGGELRMVTLDDMSSSSPNCASEKVKAFSSSPWATFWSVFSF